MSVFEGDTGAGLVVGDPVIEGFRQCGKVGDGGAPTAAAQAGGALEAVVLGDAGRPVEHVGVVGRVDVLHRNENGGLAGTVCVEPLFCVL